MTTNNNSLLKKKSKSVSSSTRRGNKRKATSADVPEHHHAPVSKKKSSSPCLKSLNKPPPDGYTRTEEADVKLRELEAQLKNLDPNSKEAKKQRRLIRNRMSAQLHRERKKAYVDHLEAEVQTRDDTIQALMREVECLTSDKRELVKRLDQSVAAHKEQEHVFTDMLTSEDMLEISETMMIGHLETQKNEIMEEHEEHHLHNMPSSPVTDHSDIESIGSSDSPLGSCSKVHHHHTLSKLSSSHTTTGTNNNVAMVLAVMLSLTFFGPPQHMLQWLETLKNGQALDFADVLYHTMSGSDALLPCSNSSPFGQIRVLDSITGTKWEEQDHPDKVAIQLQPQAQDRTTIQVLYRANNDNVHPSFSVLVPTKPGMDNSSSCRWLEIGEVSSKF